jgi:Tfp pilus assembly protein PilF
MEPVSMRTLNVRFALVLFLCVAASAAAVVGVHYFQTGRITQALLWQAERAAQEEHPEQAAKFLQRYLEFRPQDVERRVELGRLLASEKLAVTPRARSNALYVLETLVAREPGRNDLRRLIVRLAMEGPRPRLKLAREHAEALRQADPNDGEVVHWLGLCQEADAEDPRAAEKASALYAEAVRKSPQRTDTYVRLAALYRGSLSRPEQADQVMDDLVKANGESFQAYLLRGQYRLRNGSTDLAEQDLDRARELAPEEPGVLLAAAEAAQARQDYDRARDVLGHGQQLHAKDPRFCIARARLEVVAGKPQDAVAVLRDGLKRFGGPAQADLLWTLANVLLDEGNAEQCREAEGLITQLEKVKSSAVPYLQARLRLRHEDWGQAARLLERTRLTLEAAREPNRELLAHVNLYLGECYGRLREPTRQVEAYRRVLAREPASVPALLGMAQACRSLGQLGEAAKVYAQLTQLPLPATVRPSAVWTDLARLHIERSVLQEKPDWTEAEEALRQAESADAEAVDVALVRAQLLVAQNKLAEAQELLTRRRDARPRQTEFWTALADVLGRRGRWEEAEAALAAAQRELGDTADVRLAWARLWSGRRSGEAAARVAALSQNLESFADEDQIRLLQGLADASSRLGEQAQAERFWQRLAQYPALAKDPRLHMLLFELALAGGREDDMRGALAAVQRIEGDQGALVSYGKALELIWRAEIKGQTETLGEARAILDRLASQRPSWPAVVVAKAEVERLQRHPDLAIALYRKAIRLGDRSGRTVRPLVQLLYQSQRYAEAGQEIQRLQKEALTKDLKQVAAELSLRGNRPELALEHARDAVSAQSTDYRDFLWLGQVYAAGGRWQEAEQNLRRAVDLGERRPEAWVSLVQFLAGRDRAEAELVAEQARARLSGDQAPLALAQCQEALGHAEEARIQYLAALKAKPQDPLVLREVVNFLVRANRPREVEPLLRQVLNSPERGSESDAAWARRTLALVLASRGDFKSFQEAMALVGLGLDEAGRVVEAKNSADGDGEEQRARSRVLAAHNGSAPRKKAIGLLEDLGRRQLQTPDDQFLLVQLHERDGAWGRACDVLRALLAEQGPQPLYLAFYAQDLLRQENFAEAETVLHTLEELETNRKAEPGALGTVELKVQLYRAQGQHDQAVALLKEHVARKGARPEEVVVLIGYLGRVNRLDEALGLCERAWQTCPPEAAGAASVSVLKGNKPTEDQYARVESWLRTALQKQPRSTLLLMHLADLQGQRGKYQEEEAVYDEILKVDPTNIVALNNRAWLLALRSGNGSDARRLIEGALEILGPRPELLDTRAVVCMAQNQTQQAISDLERAVTLDAPTATRYFHLARAYYMARKNDAAAEAFRKAKALGLERAKLHPVEQAACGKLFDELDGR